MKIITTLVLFFSIVTCFSQTDSVLPQADIQSGFYSEMFDVTITSSTGNDTVVYTIDGSDPQTSQTAIFSKAPVIVNVDLSQVNRPSTPVFLLRMCVVQGGVVVGQSVTYSYIFLDSVLTQSYPGESWPEDSEKINDQVFDYDMDNEIIEHDSYKDGVKPALLAIPTISLVTDLNNLIQPDSGIWVNAEEHGREWERAASFEIINVDGSSAVKSNCGIRIRGGSSRNANNPKHALRLFFRDEYGAKKLEYPLFGDEGADEFDNVDLRTSQNYAWSRQGSSGAYNTMNRDVFSRDLQKQMGSPYTRSRYYHLYLNGVYWGIFMTQERAEANYAETYFGGDEEDYDVVKVFNDDRTIEATDGTLDVWNEIWEMTKNGFEDNANYTKIMGLDAEGNPDPDGTKYVDAENLIDYLMIIFFTGNFDAPTNVWSENKGAKNFFAVKNRNRNRDGFVFFEHDAEHSLFYDAISVGSGIVENRVNIGFLTGDMQMDVTEFKFFHPQFLHHKLMENSEYHQLFVDRVYKWFYKEKVLLKDNAQAVFGDRATQIEDAIIAESARWGDQKVTTPRTRDDDWVPAVDQIMNDYFGERPQIVIDQIKDVDWYTTFDAPEFLVNESFTNEQVLTLGNNDILKINNPDGQGDIYYTIDGTDPRAFGGAVSISTQTNVGDISIAINESTVVKARIKSDNTWSAMNEISLLKTDDLSELAITEIHYNPLDTDRINGKDIEFVEFKNTGSKALNLSGLTIYGGITYEFEEGTIVQPNAFVVLTSDAIEFKEFHALSATGEYKGHLSNGGDTIIISLNNVELNNIIYGTDTPWPIEADGSGNSLVPDEESDSNLPEDATYWRASYQLNGTPYKDDFKEDITNINEYNTEMNLAVYPNPASSFVNITYASDRGGELSIKMIDLLGQEVAILAEQEQTDVGMNSFFYDLKKINYSPGIYIFQLSIGGKRLNKKIILN